jgi:hypothetical protein
MEPDVQKLAKRLFEIFQISPIVLLGIFNVKCNKQMA